MSKYGNRKVTIGQHTVEFEPGIGVADFQGWAGQGLALSGQQLQATGGCLGHAQEGNRAVFDLDPFAGNTGGRGEASRNGIDAALFDRHSGGMKGGTGSDPANLDHLPMGKGPVIAGGKGLNPRYHAESRTPTATLKIGGAGGGTDGV